MMNMNERVEEGYSTQRSPMFDGKFYTYWKNKFFNLLNQNITLKETLEKVNQENIILNVELI